MSAQAGRAALALALALLLLAQTAGAQRRPTAADSAARADSVRRAAARADSLRRLAGRDSAQRAAAGAVADTTPRDSVRAIADSLRKAQERVGRVQEKINITFAAPDSFGRALLEREGYSVTRYQGSRLVFQTKENTLYLVGKRAAVQRDSTALVGDTIQFNDSTQIINARGDTLVLRDPAQGGEDVVALGSLRYDVPSRVGVMRNVTTTVESGQRWVVHGKTAAFRGDTSQTRQSVFYAKDGWLTSCEEDTPHYHFGAGELKFISKNIMIARPVRLYVGDIPILWLPFIFNDMRTGRRSGVIAPEIGFNQVFRQSPFMRRTVNDIGYYFAINDYLDAQVSVDWRSDARGTDNDPGYIKFNGIAQYRWKDRFIDGSMGVSRHYLRNGQSNEQYSIRHAQKFSERTSFSADFNYVTNTTIQRQTTFNPVMALQTISSSMRFATGRGPLSFDIGGTQKQYPGRGQLDRDFPSFRMSSKPIEVGEWLTWTPSLSLTNTESFDIDQQGDFAFRYIEKVGGGLDSVSVKRDTRNSQISFDTPLQIFGFNLRNSFRVSDVVNNFPERRIFYPDGRDTTVREERVYARTYQSGFDWETGFSLPSFFQGTWNLAPSLNFQKVDGRSPLLVRTERTGGKWVRQNFRPAAGLSLSPKFYGFFPGLGRIEQIRHALEPTISYQWSPRGSVSDEFLAANGDLSIGYLGNLPQNIVSLGFNTSFEAKMRDEERPAPPGRATEDSTQARRPTGAQEARKIRLLSMTFTTLSYDFVRAKESKGGTGLTNRNFDWSARSDLLPGFDLGVNYSLFQGDPVSDTAVFKPYREGIRATLNLDPQSPIVRGLARLVGLNLPSEEELRRQAAAERTREQGAQAQRNSAASREGGLLPARSLSRGLASSGMQVPQGQPWRVNLSFTSQRQRPPVGTGVKVFDPRAECDRYKDDPFDEALCLSQITQSGNTNGLPFNETTRGGTFYRMPPQSNVNGSMSFHVTDKWAAQWQTSYDFELKEFAQHAVSLQREMHDWDAVFAFTRAPNGNFSFNFFIALRAQPDIKFDYDRPSFPRGYTGRRSF